MGAYFERKELKYILTGSQKDRLMAMIEQELLKDPYSPYAIHSVYLDTEKDDLMMHNLDKPAFRQKLRIRSYGIPQEGKPVFLESKNKLKGITVKKREILDAERIDSLIQGTLEDCRFETKDFQRLFAKKRFIGRFFVAYDREAWTWKDNPNLRITFDRNIRSRSRNLSLHDPAGKPLLYPSLYLLEIKAENGLPLQLSQALSALRIFPASFSKASAAWNRHRAELKSGLVSEHGYKERQQTDPSETLSCMPAGIRTV